MGHKVEYDLPDLTAALMPSLKSFGIACKVDEEKETCPYKSFNDFKISSEIEELLNMNLAERLISQSIIFSILRPSDQVALSLNPFD